MLYLVYDMIDENDEGIMYYNRQQILQSTMKCLICVANRYQDLITVNENNKLFNQQQQCINLELTMKCLAFFVQ